jgi:isopentenyl phosphate kinase
MSLQFLKLGGSLITEKAQAQTPRLEMLDRLAQEIAAVWQQGEAQPLLLGHGSGSFGHVSARRYGTRLGVHNPEQWQGFATVWRDANALNRLVMDALIGAGLPAIALSPCASVSASAGRVVTWNLGPLRSALAAGLLPVVFGDVIFDDVRGGTILSTEDLFSYLAPQLRPQRLLLAGIEPGVWADYPHCTRLAAQLTRQDFAAIAGAVAGSAAVDVTGGMASKVEQSLTLVEQIPELQVLIFSGETPGMLTRALRGETVGTQILNRNQGAENA